MMRTKTIEQVLRELLKKNREAKKESKDKKFDKTDNDSALWAIITALRGPDDENYILKSYTTGRVRGILKLENNSVDVRYTPLNELELDARNELLEQRNSKTLGDHFTAHFQNALKGLKTLGYDVPEEELSF